MRYNGGIPTTRVKLKARWQDPASLRFVHQTLSPVNESGALWWHRNVQLSAYDKTWIIEIVYYSIRVHNSAVEQQKDADYSTMHKSKLLAISPVWSPSVIFQWRRPAFSGGPITHRVVSPYPIPTEEGDRSSLRNNVGSWTSDHSISHVYYKAL